VRSLGGDTSAWSGRQRLLVGAGVVLIASTTANRIRLPLPGGDNHLLLEHVVVIAVAALIVVSGRARAALAACRQRPATLLFAFIAWASIISVLRSPDVAASLEIAVWLAFDLVILVAILAIFQEPMELERVGILAAAGAAAVALLAWSSNAVLDTDWGVRTGDVYGGAAAYGLSFEPNILASLLATWLFVVLSRRQWVQSRLMIGAAVVMAAVIPLTQTRGAIVAVVLGLVVLLPGAAPAARKVILRGAVVTAVACIALVVAAPSTIDPLVNKFKTTTDVAEGSGAYRLDSWKLALSDLDDPQDWMFGLGLNSFGQRDSLRAPADREVPDYLANLPLAVLYDAGVVGVAILTLLLLSVFPRNRWRGWGLLAVFMTCAVLTSPLWFGSTWVLVALGALARRRSSTSPDVIVVEDSHASRG
jgi:hypothetical protein